MPDLLIPPEAAHAVCAIQRPSEKRICVFSDGLFPTPSVPNLP
ncbi:TPA: hypothetical protein ACFNMI_001388 [Neisseria bacilliformis]|uniref:Response regulator n=1 Tax=Neisseria bacilliformis ATCC BAA-1200 TaxID=888742 RepID=F2BB48_9NEIS|nr:hypothetical protein [Neisseria bacilliformis]EGF11308.1 response regulator [Neisseria bacilliformis ATCC BAA-1200]